MANKLAPIVGTVLLAAGSFFMATPCRADPAQPGSLPIAALEADYLVQRAQYYYPPRGYYPYRPRYYHPYYHPHYYHPHYYHGPYYHPYYH